MKPIALLFALLCALPAEAFADGAAAVHLITPKRGAQPVAITAYGQAAPSSRTVRTVSLAQTGQVASVEVTAGQAVHRGQVLMRFTTAPAVVASYHQAATAFSVAKAQAAHTRQLLSQQLATRDQAAAADKAASDAESQLRALERDGAGRSVTAVVAPFDGIVVALPVALGDRPAAGAPLATLTPLSALQVSAGVEPGWRAKIAIGASVALEPIGGGPTISGRVIRVDSVLNPKTRLVDVDVSTPPGEVLSGQAFRARIAVGSAQGWLIPHSAVQVESGEAYVFQLNGSKAVKVGVKVVQTGRDTDVVDGPIDPHRPLVTTGAYQLDDGATVRVER